MARVLASIRGLCFEEGMQAERSVLAETIQGDVRGAIDADMDGLGHLRNLFDDKTW